MKQLIDKIFRFSFLQHFLFWSASYVILIFVYRVSAQPVKIDFVYSALLHIPLLGAVYLNINILIPRFLKEQRLVIFALVLAVVSSAGSLFYIYFFDRWVDYILPGYFFIAYLNFWDFALVILIYLVSSTLFKVAKEWYLSMELQKQNKDFELQALHQQINPHFLFNTLNALYGMALLKHKQTPDSILKLSNIMRYVLQNSDTEKVKLNSEIKHIKDIVDLHKMRLGTKSEKLKLELPEVNKDIFIAPNLIMPLLENALKHSAVEDEEQFFIHIQLKLDNSDLSFCISNNLPENPRTQGHGIGLENLKRRLELLYGNKFELKAEEKINSFDVILKIPAWKKEK